jgi:hypothetical protein
MQRNKESAITTEATPCDRRELHATVTQWGLEAGLFGVELRAGERIRALVEDAAGRAAWNIVSERDRLLADLTRQETRWNDATRTVTSYRTRYGPSSGPPPGRFWRRLCGWVRDYQEYREAYRYCRRNSAEVLETRARFELAERQCIELAEWRARTAEALQATYEYQKAKAAAARQKEEKNHEQRKYHSFLVCRAD